MAKERRRSALRLMPRNERQGRGPCRVNLGVCGHFRGPSVRCNVFIIAHIKKRVNATDIAWLFHCRNPRRSPHGEVDGPHRVMMGAIDGRWMKHVLAGLEHVGVDDGFDVGRQRQLHDLGDRTRDLTSLHRDPVHPLYGAVRQPEILSAFVLRQVQRDARGTEFRTEHSVVSPSIKWAKHDSEVRTTVVTTNTPNTPNTSIGFVPLSWSSCRHVYRVRLRDSSVGSVPLSCLTPTRL